MYTGKKYESDLINSYAWDTAILFIQKCGTKTNHATYSREIGLSTDKNSSSSQYTSRKSYAFHKNRGNLQRRGISPKTQVFHQSCRPLPFYYATFSV